MKEKSNNIFKDRKLKGIFSYVYILAVILKEILPLTFSGISVIEIADKYIIRDGTSERAKLYSEQNQLTDEMETRADLVFRIISPLDGSVSIVNLEIQLFSPDYPLIRRAEVYAMKQITSQEADKNTNYENLMEVHSIWLNNFATEKFKNEIVPYRIFQQPGRTPGELPESIGIIELNLIDIELVYFNSQGVDKFLSFLNALCTFDYKTVLEMLSEYGFNVSQVFRRDLINNMTLEEQFQIRGERRGIEIGEKRGIEIGKRSGIIEGTIQTLKDYNDYSRKEIQRVIQEKFGLSPKEAEDYIKVYY